MTDDLLDEATRLADGKPQVRDDVRILRALVERVQQAEMQWRGADDMFAAMKAERDAARGKLDAHMKECHAEGQE